MNSNLIIKLLNLQQNMRKYFDRKRLKKKTHWNIYSEMMCIFNRILSAVFNQTQRIIFELIYLLIDWETVETASDFILGGSKINGDGDCSHEIKRHLLLGRKVMTNLDSIFKSRDITLPTKVRLIKAMVFPMLMYRCESCSTKKAECRRSDAFELWCWRRLLRVPWTARRSNQSILKETSPF